MIFTFFKKLTSSILVFVLFFMSIPVPLYHAGDKNYSYETYLGKIIVNPKSTQCFPYQVVNNKDNSFHFFIKILQGDNSGIDILQDKEMLSNYPFCVINRGEKRAKLEGKFISSGPIELKYIPKSENNLINKTTLLTVINIFPILFGTLPFKRYLFKNHLS